MCFTEIHVCVCLWGENRKESCILSLNLKLIKVGGYDFPTYVMAPGSFLFFKRPFVDTECDMPCVKTDSGAHSAFCAVGTLPGALFIGAKWPERDADHLPPSVEVQNA
jgi:hypothetical protein